MAECVAPSSTHLQHRVERHAAEGAVGHAACHTQLCVGADRVRHLLCSEEGGPRGLDEIVRVLA